MIPRRTVIKGAAWSVPVVAAAVALPLAAASEAPTACLRFIGTPPQIQADGTLKTKVQNQCKATARNVVLTVSYTSNGTPMNESFPIGDLRHGQPGPLDHYRTHIPADVQSVLLTVTADNAQTVTRVVRR